MVNTILNAVNLLCLQGPLYFLSLLLLGWAFQLYRKRALDLITYFNLDWKEFPISGQSVQWPKQANKQFWLCVFDSSDTQMLSNLALCGVSGF